MKEGSNATIILCGTFPSVSLCFCTAFYHWTVFNTQTQLACGSGAGTRSGVRGIITRVWFISILTEQNEVCLPKSDTRWAKESILNGKQGNSMSFLTKAWFETISSPGGGLIEVVNCWREVEAQSEVGWEAQARARAKRRSQRFTMAAFLSHSGATKQVCSKDLIPHSDPWQDKRGLSHGKVVRLCFRYVLSSHSHSAPKPKLSSRKTETLFPQVPDKQCKIFVVVIRLGVKQSLNAFAAIFVNIPMPSTRHM